MSLRIVEEAGFTDVGQQRHTNEDAFFAAAPLFAVADGMGGAQAGEVASTAAVDELSSERSGDEPPETQLEQLIRSANRRIYELAQADEARAGMGTTLSAVLVSDGEIAIGHVGDSRIYRLRGEGLERLTSDHSLVEEMVRQGRLRPEEAETHPQRSIITRALGPEPDVQVDTLTYPARPGDVYLLCSDGLTSMVSEDEIATVLRSRSSLDQAGRELIEMANEAGGKDNITVVLLRLEAAEEGAEEEDTLTGAEATAVGEALAAAPVEEEEAPDDGTMVMSAAEAKAARQAETDRRALRDASSPARSAPRKRPKGPVTGARRVLLWAFGLLLVVALLVGLYVGSRQFYFVGTNDRATVALYRGLPYELPLGIKLYSTDYESSTPARAICASRRKQILDHELRSRGDAVDLVRQIERGRLEC